MVEPIPENYPRVSVALCVDGAADAIEFYKDILGATERMRFERSGRIGHCELEIGDSLLMVSDEFPEMDFRSPEFIGGTPVSLVIYVADVDATFAAALAAGATESRPVEDQFHGDRSGEFIDPWGHRWAVMSHIEDVDDAEINRRVEAMMDELGVE